MAVLRVFKAGHSPRGVYWSGGSRSACIAYVGQDRSMEYHPNDHRRASGYDAFVVTRCNENGEPV